jgi:hypothetical protein
VTLVCGKKHCYLVKSLKCCPREMGMVALI